ncbi:hypothetical protein [Candidatus Phycosocius spiralis]|uniref:Uncharacterized protein n=1 Tax=Candidatus Phycosocius spiralis TaxID=2815099 RepID=A0ABQ4PWI0_9PROT|nr:hypothetical protein [Candidatus Phycosocius spiralis]GIU67425.1 hypothetical protein PsB1_1579 [Candidatus Phycosocius spiralis]
METRITCAIAELGQRAYRMLTVSIAVGIIFQILPGRGIDSSLEGSSFNYFSHAPFGPILLILANFLVIFIGTPLGDRDDLRNPTYQSGIPQRRTRLSRALLVVSMLILISFMVYMVTSMINHTRFQDSHIAELVGFYIVFAISSHGAAVIERVRWVLELRAEQGHVLAFGEEGEEVDTGSRIPWYRRATR